MNNYENNNDLQEKNFKSHRLPLFLLTMGVVVICVFILFMVQRWQDKKAKIIVESPSIHAFLKLSDLTYYDKDEKNISLFGKAEKESIIVYWGSYCTHCVEGMNGIEDLKKAVEQAGAEFYLIDKLDGTKETKKQALDFLSEKQIGVETLFDLNCENYDKIGISMIPTTFAVNKEGMITSVLEGDFPDIEQAKLMIEEAKLGKTKLLEQTIINNLLTSEGGMRTTLLDESENLPSGGDVLSESQGVLLEYAASTENKELFDKIWNYTYSKFFTEGIAPWVITDKQDIFVNALIDDLRILGALYTAQKNWGGYEKIGDTYKNAIFTYNTKDGNPVNFYDVNTKQMANQFTLCFGDLRTLSKAGENDKQFQKLYNNTYDLIKGGYISDDFPFYYSYYDYTAQKYVKDDLNMAEAFTTLWHLAQVDKLPEKCLVWMEERLKEGVIYAGYDIKGNPLPEKSFESTAVYALAALTALEAGRADIAGKALSRMEQFKVRSKESTVNGAFGAEDGSGIYSFDQGMALLLYEQFERQGV